MALPGALRAKYPNAPRDWGWQWVFPATRLYVDPTTGEKRRHHLHESVLQRAVKDAALATGIARPATSHSLRHYAGSQTMPSDGRFGFGVGPKWQLETEHATCNRWTWCSVQTISGRRGAALPSR